MNSTPAGLPSPHVFTIPAFRYNFISRIAAYMAMMIESITLGWLVYNVARATHSIEQSALLVGMIGLVQFVPMFCLTLPAGEMVDRYNRRAILLIVTGCRVVLACIFAYLASQSSPSLTAVFILAGVFGVFRAFLMPASSAILPMLVPRHLLPRAIAWGTLSMQCSMILGPWIGGVLCATSPAAAFITAAVLYAVATASYACIRGDTTPVQKQSSRLLLIKEGLHYIWNNKIVFGAISLDLFACLLGGATALLPVYARDVLHIGADGFGLLRAGTAIGAASVTLLLAFRPIERRAGLKMFAAVAVYGLFTLVFAWSTWLPLSMVALAVLGGADAISVNVRQTLIQMATPDPMRGRVSAVSSVFISASNELGEFESGIAARLLGPVGAAVFGGIGALVVTGLWAKMFPALRKVDNLHDLH